MSKYTKRVGGRVMAGQRRKWLITSVVLVVIVVLLVFVAIGVWRLFA